MRSGWLGRIRQCWHLLPWCIESLFQLVRCKLWVSYTSPQSWITSCGYFQSETLKHDDAVEQATIRTIARTVRGVAKYVPWKSLCLDQALAVQQMLARRYIPHTLYLGMAKNSEQQWMAHAWVRAGSLWVIGHSREVQYTVVGSYARVFLREHQ